MISPELRAKVATTRAKQGLPQIIKDPATLERAAAALRLAAPDGPLVPSSQKHRRTATLNDPEVAPLPQ